MIFLWCVIFGILMAWLIEFPVLRLRERFWLPEQAAVAAPSAAASCEVIVSARKA
jgi:hypothetical protein